MYTATDRVEEPPIGGHRWIVVDAMCIHVLHVLRRDTIRRLVIRQSKYYLVMQPAAFRGCEGDCVVLVEAHGCPPPPSLYSDISLAFQRFSIQSVKSQSRVLAGVFGNVRFSVTQRHYRIGHLSLRDVQGRPSLARIITEFSTGWTGNKPTRDRWRRRHKFKPLHTTRYSSVLTTGVPTFQRW